MNRVVASMILVLACTTVARADDLPSYVVPFLGEDAEVVNTVTGAFGPAKDTTIVVSSSIMGEGSFSGFALVPDAKAKLGQRKLALPKLPAVTMDGAHRIALVANLDKDADDEVVLEFHVSRSVASPQGGYSYGTYEYAVLDWNGKQFVRLPQLEKKLAATLKAREDLSTKLTDDELRAALGLAKKK